MTVDLVITWPAAAQETDGDRIFLDRVVGLQAEDLQALPQVSCVRRAAVRDGAVGKGASGPGVVLVLEVVERVVQDLSGLVGLGLALREIIRLVSHRRGNPPALLNEAALAALAAASAAEELDGTYYLRTIPLSVDGTAGTDERDVWASCFEAPEEGAVHVVFLSPTGLVLGHVRVPVELYFDQSAVRRRTARDIARWWGDS